MLNNAKFDSPLNLYEAEGQAYLKIRTILGGWEIRRSFNQIGIHAGDRIRVLAARRSVARWLLTTGERMLQSASNWPRRSR